ncbi:MAG: cupin domain-containing protein [Candidatus Promineifilaceae bacterium]|jgi:putative monooxygenase
MKIIRLDEREPVEAEGYRKLILLDEEDLHSKGARVQIVTIQPGDTVADHYHERAREFYLVLQGRCELTVNGETSTLRRDDMLLMEPGDVHSLSNHGAIPFVVLVFKTNGENDTHWSSPDIDS